MAGRIFEAGLQLLDRQLIDKDGKHAGKVDDLELEFPDGGGPPVVTAILAGPGALSRRLGGQLGPWLEAAANRLREGDARRPARIPFAVVKEIASAITLSVTRPSRRPTGWKPGPATASSAGCREPGMRRTDLLGAEVVDRCGSLPAGSTTSASSLGPGPGDRVRPDPDR